MIVVAQKKSMDPVQQALRESKKKWNKKVSTFIDDLIHLKKMMNGWPSKFLMQRSKITEPLPSDPATILGVLNKDFVEIVHQGNDIIATQIAYSKTRKKKMPKQSPVASESPSTPAIDLSQQLSLPSVAALELEDLVSLGSNPLTRFLSSLKGPRFGKSIEAVKRRARLSLLSYSSQIYKLCSQFQTNVIKYKMFSDDYEGIEDANNVLLEIENKVTSMFQSLQAAEKSLSLIENIPSNIEDEKSDKDDKENKGAVSTLKSDVPKSDVPIITQINDISSDPIVQEVENKIIPDWTVSYTMLLDMSQELQKKMHRQVERYYASVGNEKLRIAAANNIINLYQEILLNLNTTRGTNESSLAKIIELSSTANDDLISYDLESQAAPSATKMHGKLMRSLTNRTTTSSRLLAYNYAEEMRKGLDNLMNKLEKDFNSTELTLMLNNDIITPFFNMKESFDSILSNMQLDTSKLSPDQKKKLDKLMVSRKNREMARRLVPNMPVIPKPIIPEKK